MRLLTSIRVSAELGRGLQLSSTLACQLFLSQFSALTPDSYDLAKQLHYRSVEVS